MNELHRLEKLSGRVAAKRGRVLVLCGAGISAESGIPTFRGKDGFWTSGSTVYQPQEIATYAFFMTDPTVTWGWYLFRRAACRRAEPNPAHLALVAMEKFLGPRFTLVTQNVDGLHRRAGTSPERLMEIHGNLDRFRCSEDCSTTTWTVPADFDRWEQGRELDDDEAARLHCPDCGAWGRPHVLWFDEYYDETHFRFMSAQRAAREADLLVVVGTTGATNLPLRIAGIAVDRGTPFIDINIEDNVFRDQAASDPDSLVLDGSASRWLPEIVRCFEEKSRA